MTFYSFILKIDCMSNSDYCAEKVLILNLVLVLGTLRCFALGIIQYVLISSITAKKSKESKLRSRSLTCIIIHNFIFFFISKPRTSFLCKKKIEHKSRTIFSEPKLFLIKNQNLKPNIFLFLTNLNLKRKWFNDLISDSSEPILIVF